MDTTRRPPASPDAPAADLVVCTVGHGALTPEQLVSLLRTGGVRTVVDVRAQPGSRRSPHFHRDAMPAWLGEAGIDYRHLPALTGRRARRRDVPPELNAGWENVSFRNYADHTLTVEYEEGLATLTEIAGRTRAALMCGEPSPWRCHRSLIATTLTVRGWDVRHLSPRGTTRHVVGAWGATPVVHDTGVVTYPSPEP